MGMFNINHKTWEWHQWEQHPSFPVTMVRALIDNRIGLPWADPTPPVVFLTLWFYSLWDTTWEQEIIWPLLSTESWVWIPLPSLSSCGCLDRPLHLCESQFPSFSKFIELIKITKDKIRWWKGRHPIDNFLLLPHLLWLLVSFGQQKQEVEVFYKCVRLQLLIKHFRFLLSKLVSFIFYNWCVFFFCLLTLICFYLSHLTEFHN